MRKQLIDMRADEALEVVFHRLPVTDLNGVVDQLHMLALNGEPVAVGLIMIQDQHRDKGAKQEG